jgi:hypothetical protein
MRVSLFMVVHILQIAMFIIQSEDLSTKAAHVSIILVSNASKLVEIILPSLPMLMTGRGCFDYIYI